MSLLSLAHLSILDADPAVLVRAAARAGFDAVGLRVFTRPGSPLKVQIAGDEAVIAEVRTAVDETGIRVLDIEAFGLSPEFDKEQSVRGLEAGAALGADRLLAVGADMERSRLLENLGWLAETASGYGIRVGLEFIPYAVIDTLEAALDVIHAVSHPNVGLLLDALHLSRSGGDPSALAAVPAGLFAYAQISDAVATIPNHDDLPAEARTDRRLLGEGDLWLEELLHVLPNDLPLSVEAPVKRHAQKSVDERARILHGNARPFIEAVRTARS